MDPLLFNSFDFVTLGNRSAKTLTVTYDGKQWTLPPHPATIAVPRIVADVACRQHPRMGTEDPYNPREYELLVFVREWQQDETPLEQSDALERIDRKLLPPDLQKVMQVNKHYRPSRAMDSGEGGVDAMFDGRGLDA